MQDYRGRQLPAPLRFTLASDNRKKPGRGGRGKGQRLAVERAQGSALPGAGIQWWKRLAASRASWRMPFQSSASPSEFGVSQEPPTHITFLSAR